MNRLSPFLQKIVYICLIVGLLIPLSFIARPATNRGETGTRDTGGKLASLRNQYNLSQAKIGEVDPASETMKLMSLGFRSVAATSLWLNAIDAQIVKDWDRFATTLGTLMKIQPNFHKVWDYQAHNMAYNTSVEFDDYEQRYSWVKKGLDLLRQGLVYNQRDHRFTDTLGKYTGQKIGRSDEKVEFRELFRNDEDYHASLDNLFDRDSYDAGQYGKDNWLLAYQWYNRSIAMVEQGIGGEQAVLRTKEMIFYMNRPAQRRNHVISLQSEFPPEESFKFKWRSAYDEWIDYGNREILTQFNVPISMEGLVKTEIEMRKLRNKLDAMAPGIREKIMAETEQQISISAEDKALLDRDPESLSDEESRRIRRVLVDLEEANKKADDAVLAATPAERRGEANDIYLQIKSAYVRIMKTEQDRSTVNYQFWKDRTNLEMTDGALAAHQSFYDAHEKHRGAVFEDFVRLDPAANRPVIDEASGEPIHEPGAVSEFVDGFRFWADQSDAYPSLADSAMFDFMLEDAALVREMVDALGKPWPKNFPFQRFIDANPALAQNHRLPTSADLNLGPPQEEIPTRPSLDLD